MRHWNVLHVKMIISHVKFYVELKYFRCENDFLLVKFYVWNWNVSRVRMIISHVKFCVSHAVSFHG